MAKDGRLVARAAFIARKQGWQRLLDERSRVAAEIRAVAGEVRDLEKRLHSPIGGSSGREGSDQ